MTEKQLLKKTIDELTNIFKEFLTKNDIELNDDVYDFEELKTQLENTLKSNNTKMKKISDKKVQKKEKDINKPKKNQSEYIFFCTSNRSKVKEENPEAKPNRITQILAMEWKQLKTSQEEEDIKEMEKYREMAKQDVIRYQTEMEKYREMEKEEDSEDNSYTYEVKQKKNKEKNEKENSEERQENL